MPDDANSSFAISINDRGEVVGMIDERAAYWDCDCSPHTLEFRWDAPRLNNLGVAAANSETGVGLLWSLEAGIQAIPGTGAMESFFVSDFNDLGQVLGFTADAG